MEPLDGELRAQRRGRRAALADRRRRPRSCSATRTTASCCGARREPRALPRPGRRLGAARRARRHADGRRGDRRDDRTGCAPGAPPTRAAPSRTRAHSEEIVEAARASVARLLGADPRGVAFGPSMTALTMAFAAAVGRALRPGDEVVCTRLDHDANVRPWVIAAERAGARVRFAEPEPGTLELPAAAVETVLSERTRWVAVTAASNAVGTVPDLAGDRRRRARASAPASTSTPCTPRRTGRSTSRRWAATRWPARPTSGSARTSASSARAPELLAELTPDKLRPSPDTVPDRWELGHAARSRRWPACGAAADYVAGTGLGRGPRARGRAAGRRARRPRRRSRA